MTDSHAESLDPSVLGEEVGDDDRPAADYPPDEALAVEDPSIVDEGLIARDDVATRDRRQRPEVDGSVTEPVRERFTDGLIDTNVSPDGNDHEERLIADRGDADTGPEADALHVQRD
jgi:hypothetical protein